MISGLEQTTFLLGRDLARKDKYCYDALCEGCSRVILDFIYTSQFRATRVALYNPGLTKLIQMFLQELSQMRPLDYEDLSINPYRGGLSWIRPLQFIAA